MKRMPQKGRGLGMRLAALCAAAVIALGSLTGCATGTAIADGKGFDDIMAALRTDLFGSETQDCRQLSLALPLRYGFEPVEDKSAYRSLNDTVMQSVYQEIEQSIFRISDEVDEATGYYVMQYTRLPSSLDFDDIYVVKEAVISDHPEAFWILGSYDIRNNFHDGNYLVLFSKYSHEQITAAFQEINQATEEILGMIPDGAGELEREMIIHDALVDSIEYDFDVAESDDATADAFNIYGALVRKKAVCSGYACAAKMLLNRVGIQCRTVVGMSKNTGHMWNQVKINGNWYHLDVTWNDSSAGNDGVLYVRYHYFNLSDELIKKNHTIGKNYSQMVCEYTEDGVYTTAELYNFDLEPCDTLDANYYEMNAAHISELGDDAIRSITEKMIDASKTQEEIIYILFDSSVPPEEAEAWLAQDARWQYSTLKQSINSTNNYGIGRRIKTASLWRFSSDDESVWENLYAVRLFYA